MLFTEAGQDTLMSALRLKRLVPRDVAVLMGLIVNCDWRSGRVRITQKALAAQMGEHTPNVSASVGRLQRLRMVARVRDPHTGEQFFLINPDLAAVGGPQRRGHLAVQFDEAFGSIDEE